MKLYQPLIFLFYGHAFGQITLNCRVNPHSNGGFCVTGKDGQSPAGHQIQYNHNNGTLSPKLTVKTDFKDCFNFEYSINPLTDQKNFGWERLDTNLLQDGDRTSVVAYTHKAFKKTVCNADHQCGKHDQTYNWCYTKAKWQYCSVSSATTASDALCKNGCTSNGENYECDCDDCSASWKRKCSPPGKIFAMPSIPLNVEGKSVNLQCQKMSLQTRLSWKVCTDSTMNQDINKIEDSTSFNPVIEWFRKKEDSKSEYPKITFRSIPTNGEYQLIADIAWGEAEQFQCKSLSEGSLQGFITLYVKDKKTDVMNAKGTFDHFEGTHSLYTNTREDTDCKTLESAVQVTLRFKNEEPVKFNFPKQVREPLKTVRIENPQIDNQDNIFLTKITFATMGTNKCLRPKAKVNEIEKDIISSGQRARGHGSDTIQAINITDLVNPCENKKYQIILTDYNDKETAHYLEIKASDEYTNLIGKYISSKLVQTGGNLKIQLILKGNSERNCVRKRAKISNLLENEENLSTKDALISSGSNQFEVTHLFSKCEPMLIKLEMQDKFDKEWPPMSQKMKNEFQMPMVKDNPFDSTARLTNSLTSPVEMLTPVSKPLFQNCSDLRYEFQCKGKEEPIEIEPEEITFENLFRKEAKNCKVRVKFQEDTSNEIYMRWNSNAAWSPNFDIPDLVGFWEAVLIRLKFITIPVSIVLVQVLAALLMFGYNQTWNKIDAHAPIPKHRSFGKHDDLKAKLVKAARQKGASNREFKAITNYANNTIEPFETVEAGSSKHNEPRNGQSSILPYDSTRIALNEHTGNPPSCYVNGSRINFSAGTVDFLAVETPKQNMLSSFWELVVEQSPKVVVMFGDAEDRHWPDRDNPIMEMDNMIWLTLRGNTIHQHFVHRQIDITDRYGREKTIDHLHCSNWKTGTIPSITQLLLSMVYKAQEILKESTEDTPDRILVESKTGSGRAGTFIAVYQSIEELNDGTISTIDPFLTVVEMRRGRERMVESSLQFHHVIQCVSDHVVCPQRNLIHNSNL